MCPAAGEARNAARDHGRREAEARREQLRAAALQTMAERLEEGARLALQVTSIVGFASRPGR